MSHMQALLSRAQNQCELCGSTNHLSIYGVKGQHLTDEDSALIICSNCKLQIETPSKIKLGHWQCLLTTIWSEYGPVKIMCYRILEYLKKETWASELLEQLYLSDEELIIAKAEPLKNPNDNQTVADDASTIDANGTKLLEGDSVTLIKDLNVKGAGFTAKRGTIVKNIHLTNNPEHIEGKVNGTAIVIIAEFVKKSI